MQLITEETPIVKTNSSSQVEEKFYLPLLKSALEQAETTAQGGAVVVNHIKLFFSMMGHKLSIADHQKLEGVLLGYWALRGTVGGVVGLSGLKDKCPDAIDAYLMTEKSIIRTLAITNFLRSLPISKSANVSLQLVFALVNFSDFLLTAQANAAKIGNRSKRDYPEGASVQEIKKYYSDEPLKAVLTTLKEMFQRCLQTGASTYVAGSALAVSYYDARVPVDPANQPFILLMLALAGGALGAASVFHPRALKIRNFINSVEVNIALVFYGLVSLVYDFAQTFFGNNELSIAIVCLVLTVVIPAILKIIVEVFDKKPNVNMDSHRNSIPREFSDVTVNEAISGFVIVGTNNIQEGEDIGDTQVSIFENQSVTTDSQFTKKDAFFGNSVERTIPTFTVQETSTIAVVKERKDEVINIPKIENTDNIETEKTNDVTKIQGNNDVEKNASCSFV